VGKKADLCIIDMDKPHLTPLYSEYSHLVYAVNSADVHTVIINAQMVMRDRKLLTIDENDTMRRVREIALRIRRSLSS
jgi:5-methylthioadenosine/S-adenosylhomocysteine deaminase